jgi:hypothetical protein
MVPKFNPDILLALWERAAEEEMGIAIETSDPVRLRHQIWEAKPDGEAYEDLMTFCPEGRKEVFIIRKSVELPDATPTT